MRECPTGWNCLLSDWCCCTYRCRSLTCQWVILLIAGRWQGFLLNGLWLAVCTVTPWHGLSRRWHRRGAGVRGNDVHYGGRKCNKTSFDIGSNFKSWLLKGFTNTDNLWSECLTSFRTSFAQMWTIPHNLTLLLGMTLTWHSFLSVFCETSHSPARWFYVNCL